MSKYIELTNAYLYSFLLRIDINHKAWVDTFFLCRLFFPLSLFILAHQEIQNRILGMHLLFQLLGHKKFLNDDFFLYIVYI